jgi:signal transduction histidine kinase
VALAVKQCLVNVLKHADTNVAEVVIYGAGDEVSIMIIDGGKGFSERETSVDRLGLRQSVRKRIESVDGSVQVWSTPGTGTSILIRLPAKGPVARERAL